MVSRRAMNKSIENFLKICNFINKKYDVVTSFESRKYEINRISNIVFLSVLIISTFLLNAVAATTVWKTDQLRKKPCYFVILLQSSFDLGVSCVSLPIFIVALLAPFTNIDICSAVVVVRITSGLPIGLSIVTLSAMNIERYIGVVHPFSYKTLVTRGRIVMFVFGGGIVLLLAIVASIFSEHLIMKYAAMGMFVAFLIFTSFVYLRIYLVVQRLSRSNVSPHEDGGKESKKRRRVLREIKHAMSCFTVVICFFVLLVLFTFFPIFNRTEKMNLNVYVWWCVALFNLNPCINSLIFFWKSTALRKQAIKILKSPTIEAPGMDSTIL